MILQTYIMMEIIKPLITMFTVLITIFATYSSAHYLADAVYDLMPMGTVAMLIMLKILISMEILIPITFYLSVIMGIGRLYKDNEMLALFASGLGIGKIFKVVFLLSLLAASLVASLSLYVRPWAYDLSYRLKAEAKANFDVSLMKEDKFYEINGQGNRVIFLENIKPYNNKTHDNIVEGVFLQKDTNDMLEIVYAKNAFIFKDPSTDKKVIRFKDGQMYRFPRNGKKGFKIVNFDEFLQPLLPKEIKETEYKIKAASTVSLFKSGSPLEIAELQWRLSLPFSAILLALIGIPLSHTTPRDGKYARMTTAILIFAFYYGMIIMAKIWVEKEFVATAPGIWWAPGLLAILLITLLRFPSVKIKST